jgi:hypothetical protein
MKKRERIKRKIRRRMKREERIAEVEERQKKER